jgi:hypothetical protein
MIILYCLLSKDEERRMLNLHPQTYKSYMEKTGMFLPIIIERRLIPSTIIGKYALFVLIAVFTMVSVFSLRYYTIKQLPLWSSPNIVVFALIPDDVQKIDHRMNDILLMPEIKARLKDNEKYLVYFIPVDYIMQGLIADTGKQWRLFNRHMTLSRFSDWVIHPFSHLDGHCSMDMANGESMDMSKGIVRRLIFIDISGISIETPYDLFSINALRSPQFMVDVDIHNLKLIDMKNLSQDTGWGKLPTPTF